MLKLTHNVLQAIREECVDLYFKGFTVKEALEMVCKENGFHLETVTEALLLNDPEK